jgi:hypothetical protein
VAGIEARRARLEGKMATSAERAEVLRAEKIAKAARMSHGNMGAPPPPPGAVKADGAVMPPPPPGSNSW